MNVVDWLQQPSNLWICAGLALVLFDALHLGGIGLLFAGLGAIVTGIALHTGWFAPDEAVPQLVVFFLSSALLAALLWKPIKKFRAGRPTNEYSNIVGDTAYVGSNGLTRDQGGEVTWSGTIMKAQIASDVQAYAIEAGAKVEIVAVSGATLMVKPK